MIIKNKVFKASMLEHSNGKLKTARAHGYHQTPGDEWSLATAKYYARHIDDANTNLKLVRAGLAARLKPALKMKERRRMLGWLGAKLEYYAWEYHCSLTPGNLDVVPSPTGTQVNALNTGASLAKHALDTITAQFGAMVQAVTSHVDQDWLAIGTVFFPSWDLQELVRLDFLDSDPHKGGKSVVLLTFTATHKIHTRRKKTLRLVYKPSDVTIDYLLVGEVGRARAVDGTLPNPPGGSLLENLNAQIAGNGFVANNVVNARPRPVLPTYPILPRNSGNLTTAYGYIKFLTFLPKPVVQPTAMRTRKLKLAAARRDWIAANNQEIVDYYRIFGWYGAIAMTFGLADAHQGNIIVHRKKPYLIDNEISFKWRCESFHNTLLNDAMNSWSPWSDTAEPASDKCQLYYANATSDRVDATKGARAASIIKAGLREAFDLIALDPNGALRAWLGSPALANAIVRYTVMQTKDYGTRLRQVYFRQAIGGAVPNPAQANTYHAGFNDPDRYRKWYDGDEDEHRPGYSMLGPNHDWADYLSCDYPAYYRRLNSLDLLNGRGVTVTVAAPPLPFNDPTVHAQRTRTIAGTRFFDHYPAVFLFTHDDVNTLNNNQGLAHLDANVVADLRQTFANLATPINLGNGAVGTAEDPGQRWRITDGNRIFHVLRVGATDAVEAYEVGSGVAMTLSMFDRIRADNNYRTRLRNAAEAAIGNIYPGQPPGGAPAVYDNF